jgi:bacterioferritin-associated ferredoxin
VGSAIAAGAATVDDVKEACGVGATCSTCRRAVEAALADARAEGQ